MGNLLGFFLIGCVVIPEFLHDFLAIREMTAVIADPFSGLGKLFFQLRNNGLVRGIIVKIDGFVGVFS
jgi:hypothetical protein